MSDALRMFNEANQRAPLALGGAMEMAELQSLQIELIKKQKQRSELVSELTGISRRNIEINSKFSAGKFFSRMDYNSIIQEQRKLKSRAKEIESSIGRMKPVISAISVKIEEIKRAQYVEEQQKINKRLFSQGLSSDISTGIAALRGKYLDFSCDQTRVASMRLMASQFVSDLDEILKPSGGGA